MIERAHTPFCKPSITPSVSCLCDGLTFIEGAGWLENSRYLDIVAAMKITGWMQSDRQDSTLLFLREHQGQHISVARLFDGWSYIWMVGGTYTVREERSFGSPAACLNHLWSQVFEMNKRRLELERAEAVRNLEQAQKG